MEEDDSKKDDNGELQQHIVTFYLIVEEEFKSQVEMQFNSYTSYLVKGRLGVCKHNTNFHKITKRTMPPSISVF